MLLPILFLPLVATALVDPPPQKYVLEIENGILKNVRPNGDAVLELDLSSRGLLNLERTAFDNVPSLKSLNLANNSLVSLPEFMFSNLTNLEYLNLAQNNLTCLKNLFIRQDKLQILNVSCNPVMHLRWGHLFGLTKSVTILTEGNAFWSINTGTFFNSFLKKQLEKTMGDIEQTREEKEKEMDAVKEDAESKPEDLQRSKALKRGQKLKLCVSNKMVLSLEPLEDGKKIAEGGSCSELPINEEERKVSLRNLGIEGFLEGWYQLQNLPIVSLDLSSNDITEISKELLNDLPEDLVFVNLMQNRITALYSEVIENRHLKMLNLKDNLIRNIEDNALQNTNLTGLFLSGNQLDDLSFLSTIPQTLEGLVLSNNRITSIPTGAFSNLSRLQYLKLANNNINTLQNNLFRGLDSLQVLVATRNNLTRIEPQAFTNLKRLTTLYLDRNSLSNLQGEEFAELESLRNLDLAWNRFEKITRDMFANLPRSLDSLRIEYNEINSLEEGSFRDVPRFALSLAGNKISSIPKGAFDLPTLRDLSLNNNTLTSIDGDSYAGLPRLMRLWLTNNQIMEISKGSCKNLASLYVLDISKNPFQRLENGALYGLSLNRGTFLYIYGNQLKELQGGVFDNV